MHDASVAAYGPVYDPRGQVLLEQYLHAQAGRATETLLNRLMEAERDDHLACARYQRSPHRRGYRNGYETRPLDTGFGRLLLRHPRVRGTEAPFRTMVVAAYQRRWPEVERAIRRWVAGGLSTRAAAAEAIRCFGAVVSPTTVSHLVAALDEEIQAFPLERFIRELARQLDRRGICPSQRSWERATYLTWLHIKHGGCAPTQRHPPPTQFTRTS